MSLQSIRSGTIYAVAPNGTQVKIVDGAMTRLRAHGLDVRMVVIEGASGRPGAEAYLAKRGWETPMELGEVCRIAKSGDLVLTTLIAGPKKKKMFCELVDRGVIVANVVEGCRFLLDKAYIRDRWVPLLGWGPSIAYTGVADTRIVGSAVYEPMRELAPDEAPIAMINYKFAFAEARKDPHGAWASAAVAAARANGFNPIISVHPSSVMPPRGLAEISTEPFEELLARSHLLISRSSGLVYHALRWGVQPFFLKMPGEALGEFKDPLGAFALASTEDALITAIEDWVDERTTYNPNRFFARHLDIQPDRPADLRLAVELLRLRRDARRRVRAGLSATDLPGKDWFGLERLGKTA